MTTSPDPLLTQLTSQRLIELTDTLVRIPSVTGEEHAIVDWVTGFFERTGLRGITRLPVAEAGDSVFGWIDGPEDGPTFCLNFHLDTFAAFNGWDTDPLTPTIRGNRMYGLGAADMKAGGACVLAVAEVLARAKPKLKGRVLIACTSDEENWSRGAHALIASGALRSCIGALVPEPSPYGKLRIGARGRHVITVTLHGRSAHVAYDLAHAISAADDAARLVLALEDASKLGLGHSAEFNMPSSLNVIGVRSGGTMILVPELAQVFIDRHLLPGETLDDAIAHLRGLIEALNLRSRYALSWDERPTPAPGAYVVDAQTAFVQTVQRLLETEIGQPVTRSITRSVADINHFAVHGGVPTLVAGPWGGHFCEANEWVDLDALLPCARVHLGAVLEMMQA
jgi:succinyl-diaminopimelate desuccinylase